MKVLLLRSLTHGITDGGQHHAGEEEENGNDLLYRIPFTAIDSPHGHGGHGPCRPQDNMQGNADPVPEGHVVEDVDCQEIRRVDDPFAERDGSPLEVQVSPSSLQRQVWRERRQSHHEELQRRDQRSRGR